MVEQNWTVFEMNQLGGTVTTIGVDGSENQKLNVGDKWSCVIKKGPANTNLLRLTSPMGYPPPYEVLGVTDNNGDLTYTHTVVAGEGHYGGQLYMQFPNPAGYPTGYDPTSPNGYHKAIIANFYYDVSGSDVVTLVQSTVPITPVLQPTVSTPVAQPSKGVVPSSTVIQYTSDFSGLTYLDALGNIVTVRPIEGQAFNDVATIMQAQISAEQANIAAANAYNQKVDNEQISVSAGRLVPDLGPKPQMQIVSNAGVVSYQDFDPPLHVIVPLVVNAPNSGQIKTTVNLPPDPVAQSAAQQTTMMAMLQAIMAALKAKGIM